MSGSKEPEGLGEEGGATGTTPDVEAWVTPEASGGGGRQGGGGPPSTSESAGRPQSARVAGEARAEGLDSAERFDRIIAGRPRRGPAASACARAEQGFRLGLRLPVEAVRALDAELRPFAFEGAGAAGGERPALSAVEAAFWELGEGVAAAAGFGPGGGEPAQGPLGTEGLGFGDALLRLERALSREEADPAYDLGVGRGLWFVHAGEPARIRASIAGIVPGRRAGVWEGVGRAAVFAGGGPPDRVGRLAAHGGEPVWVGARVGAWMRAEWGRRTSDAEGVMPQGRGDLGEATAAGAAPDGATSSGETSRTLRVFGSGAAIRGLGAVSAARGGVSTTNASGTSEPRAGAGERVASPGSGGATGVAALLEAARAGRSGIRAIRRFSTAGFTVGTAALVEGYEEPAMTAELDGRAQALALEWARQALAEALAGLTPVPRTALVVGSNLEDRPESLDRLFATLGREHAVDGPCYVVSTACASGTAALGHALDLLDRGDADRVLAGGVDVITPRVFAGFHVLGALTERAAPFSSPFGMSLGEGAAFFVLERARPGESAVLGWGLAADAFHETRPLPDGSGVTAAVRSALTHAGITALEVRYVNAHGTGTEANDGPECLGLRAALPHQPPTSSAKGMLGHAQGAAGALEVALTLACRSEGLLPPTVGFNLPRLDAPVDPVPRARIGDASTFVSTSSAFGGVNAAVVIGPARGAPRPTRPVGVLGEGRWETGASPAPSDLPRGVDPDALSPPVAWVVAAIHRALGQAGLKLDRSRRARTGLVLGTRQVLARDGKALGDEIRARGLGGVSGSVFARALLVTPAGAVSAALGLRGPLDVVVAGPESGALALVHAAWLATRPDVEWMVAAAVDDPDGPDAPVGASAVLLGTGGRSFEGVLAGSAEAAAARVGAEACAPRGHGAASSLVLRPGPSAGGGSGLGWGFILGT